MTVATKKLNLNVQIELLRHCIDSSISLEDELNRLGLSYESLRYRNDEASLNLFQQSQSRSEGLLPVREAVTQTDIPVISFFSGAGGLDLGFEAAGFHHAAAIEINSLFCDTLRKNRPHWSVLGPPVHSGDIRNKDEYSHLLRQGLSIPTPFEGVFIGGPPCQSFSIAANQRFSKSGENFKRTGFDHVDYGNLLFEFIWYIKEFRPRAFLIENVAGLLSVDDGIQVQRAVEELVAAGYQVQSPRVVNAASFGVPQYRQRVFLIGSRTGECPQFPIPDSLRVPCGQVLSLPINDVECHVTRVHRAESVLRYMEMNYGQREPLGRVDRLDPNAPSKTVIAGGAKGGGRSHLHPEIPRTLSVRESARIQTFPDDFVFCGPPARQFTQVGNAVPPLLAYKFATSIYQGAYNYKRA